MHNRFLMRGGFRFGVLAVMVFALLPSANVMAAPSPPPDPPRLPAPSPTDGGGNGVRPDVNAGTDADGNIDVSIRQPGSGGGGGPRSSPPTYTPACEWTPFRVGDFPYGAPSDSAPAPNFGEQAVDSEGRLGWIVSCPGAGPGLDIRWVTPTPDPITLVQPASDRARALLPLPVPVQSPAPDIGSFVNLGLWMSIEDPGVTTARATVGGAWAEATGQFASFSVDPGDGSGEIPCDGFGVPYTEGSNEVEEGPCGHTYLQPTPAGAPYIVTYTITYIITWQTSDGRSGTVGTFDREFDFPFDINEIQTVGAEI